jgi:hypothetical protein
MLATFPSLLLEDRLRPLTDEIGFLDLPFQQSLDAYLDWMRYCWQRQLDLGEADLATTPVTGNLETILRALGPLRLGEASRVAVVPTAGPWTAFFDNCDRGADFEALTYSLAKRTDHRTLRFTANLDVVDGQPRKHTWLPHTRFYLRGPVERQLFAWVNDNERWTWDTSGEPQPFERPEYYRARRIRDRLSIPIMAEYAAALGLRPFDADFYAPDGAATIVELTGWNPPHLTSHTLDEVQARIERGWHIKPYPW